MPKRWKEAAWKAGDGKCIVCGKRNGESGDHGRVRIQVHHVIPKGWLWANRWDFTDIQEAMWDPRNAALVCDYCHNSHHRAARRIPRYALPPAALAFAEEHDLMYRLEQEYPE